MSKILLAIIGVFLCYSIFTSSVIAQESDYDGIIPGEIPQREPFPPQAPQIEESRSQRITNLRQYQQTGFGMAKERYISTLQLKSSNSQSPTGDTSAIDYKLDAILVSARYHKTLDLYLNYLEKIDYSITDYNNSSGLDVVTDAETELAAVEAEIIDTSGTLSQFDSLVDSFAGITAEDKMNISPELEELSLTLKDQLEITRNSMLNLVSLAE